MKKLLLFVFIIISSNSFAQHLFERKYSTLEEQWDLNDSISKSRGLFTVSQYKPLYFLFANMTSDINNKPSSPSPDHTVTEDIPLNNTELKFQLSLKTKVLGDLFGSKQGGAIWMGYTQTSRWQVFNSEISRPFRETNYEPELMYVLPTKYEVFGIRGVFAGIGMNHQSNGRGLPLSRSWNRIIAQIAWETDHSSIIFRPWWRIQEDTELDDNPGIENYIGRGELLWAYGNGRHDLSFLGRHSMRFGENNRGSIQVDYSLRVWDNLKVHLQVFHGYGESMIDYNHKQTTAGIGFSLIEWR